MPDPVTLEANVPQREMTLAEYMAQLPVFHRAHREYVELLQDRAALPPVRPAEPTSRDPVTESQARAWFAVVDALNEIDPEWMSRAGRGIDAAVASIRALASRPVAPPAGSREAKYQGAWNNWIAPFHRCARCGESLNWQQSVDVFDRPLISASCACGVMYSARLGEEGLEQARAVDAGNRLAALCATPAAPVDLSAVEADKTWAAIAVVCGDVIDSIYWPDTCTHAIADGESTRECCNRLAGDRASLVGGSAHLVDLTYAAPVPAMRVENVYVALDAIARAEAAKSPTASVPVSVLNALVGVVMRTTEPMCQCGHPRVYHEPTGRCNAVMIDAMDGSTCTCEAYHV